MTDVTNEGARFAIWFTTSDVTVGSEVQMCLPAASSQVLYLLVNDMGTNLTDGPKDLSRWNSRPYRPDSRSFETEF